MDNFDGTDGFYLAADFRDQAFQREVYEEAMVIFLERRASASAALLPPARDTDGPTALPSPSGPEQKVKVHGPSRTFVLGLCLLLLFSVLGVGMLLANSLTSGSSMPPASQSSMASPGNYTITAPNELTPDQIDRLLAQYGSPASGNGQVIYDLGAKYGIDDIYFLAWFAKETSMGKSGVASVYNPTGMECSDYCPSCSGADGNGRNWCTFPGWPQGFDAWFFEMSQRYVSGAIDNGPRLTTVELIACGPNGTGMYDDGSNCHGYAAWIEHTVDQWRTTGV